LGHSLTQLLTRWFLIFAFLPAVIFGYATCKYMVVATEHSTAEILNSICQKEAEFIAFWFQERFDDLRKVIPTKPVKSLPVLEAEFKKAKAEINGCTRIACTDVQGVIRADTAGRVGDNVSALKWFDAVTSGQVHKAAIFTDPDRRAMIITMPVRAGDVQAVWAEFNIEVINSILQHSHLDQVSSLDSSGHKSWLYGFGYRSKKPEWDEIRIYLLRPDGQVLVELDNHLHAKVASPKSLPDVATKAAPEVVRWLQNKSSGYGTYINRHGEKVFAACRWIPDPGMMLVVEEKRKDVLRGLYSQGSTMILLALLLMVLLTVPLSTIVTQRVTEPLRQLAGEADKIAAGNFGHQIAVTSRGEVEMLSRAFNEMSLRLQEFYARLTRQIELLAQQKEEIIQRNHELEVLQEQLEENQAKLEEKNLRLEEIAHIDELTRVLNRRALMERAMLELKRARRYAQPVAMIMMDVDKFKQINDNCGHACGDLVLSDLAKLIKTTARVSDVVGRYGGDEFVVVLSNTDEEAALSFARRVIEKVNKHSFITPLGRLEIGVSLGVSVWQPDNGNGNGNLEERMRVLLQQADMALLESKRQGRNRATIGGKHAR